MPKQSERDLRLWGRRSEMTTLGSGLSGLAFAAALAAFLPSLSNHPRWYAATVAIAAIFGLFSVSLFSRGLIQSVPLVDIEAPWDSAYDRLRDETQLFCDRTAVVWWRHIANQEKGVPDTWEECAEQVPVPRVDERPLREWNDLLSKHDDPRVQLFYRFARVCEQKGSDYRRLAVRTYDVFRRSRDTRPGFREWMDQSEVKSGAEQLIVLLAYMEVARASTVNFVGTPTHPGFWTLAEEWHPNIVRLPRPDRHQKPQIDN